VAVWTKKQLIIKKKCYERIDLWFSKQTNKQKTGSRKTKKARGIVQLGEARKIY